MKENMGHIDKNYVPTDRLRETIQAAQRRISSEYDVNLSGLVVDKKSWDDGPLSVLPIHEEIVQEGILI